jgi:hypothetical protein
MRGGAVKAVAMLGEGEHPEGEEAQESHVLGPA